MVRVMMKIEKGWCLCFKIKKKAPFDLQIISIKYLLGQFDIHTLSNKTLHLQSLAILLPKLGILWVVLLKEANYARHTRYNADHFRVKSWDSNHHFLYNNNRPADVWCCLGKALMVNITISLMLGPFVSNKSFSVNFW